MATETKSYALSKTKVREMITKEFGETGKVEISAVLALFEGASREAGTTTVYDANGNVVGKRCSYFGVFMNIEEFGKRGETFSFQSKLAESIVRKQRTEAANEKKLLDEQLADGVLTVEDWKDGLAKIEANKEVKVSIESIEDAPTHFATAEDFKASL